MYVPIDINAVLDSLISYLVWDICDYHVGFVLDDIYGKIVIASDLQVFIKHEHERERKNLS